MTFDAGSFWETFRPRIGTELPLRVLLSYYYFRDADLDRLFPMIFGPTPVELFLDSGAFSAATQNEPLSISDYIAWLKRYQHWFQTISNLDVIGDYQATWRHQQRMEDAGLRPLPVFHTGEPWHYLEMLLERYSYIALGGMVPYMKAWKTALMPWLVRCFRLAQGRAVFHGFGCTALGIVKALPWYSVDSSTWKAGFVFGEVPIFCWERGLMSRLFLGQWPSRFWQTVVRELGFQTQDFALRSRNTSGANGALALLSYRLLSRWLARYWLPSAHAECGRMYLVEIHPCDNLSRALQILQC